MTGNTKEKDFTPYDQQTIIDEEEEPEEADFNEISTDISDLLEDEEEIIIPQRNGKITELHIEKKYTDEQFSYFKLPVKEIRYGKIPTYPAKLIYAMMQHHPEICENLGTKVTQETRGKWEAQGNDILSVVEKGKIIATYGMRKEPKRAAGINGAKILKKNTRSPLEQFDEEEEVSTVAEIYEETHYSSRTKECIEVLVDFLVHENEISPEIFEKKYEDSTKILIDQLDNLGQAYKVAMKAVRIIGSEKIIERAEQVLYNGPMDEYLNPELKNKREEREVRISIVKTKQKTANLEEKQKETKAYNFFKILPEHLNNPYLLQSLDEESKKAVLYAGAQGILSLTPTQIENIETTPHPYESFSDRITKEINYLENKPAEINQRKTRTEGFYLERIVNQLGANEKITVKSIGLTNYYPLMRRHENNWKKVKEKIASAREKHYSTKEFK